MNFIISVRKNLESILIPSMGEEIECRAEEENHARCVAHHNYPIGGGKIERLAWEHAHGWD